MIQESSILQERTQTNVEKPFQNTKCDKSKINNNNHNMSFLFVLHFVYIWGWNKSKPEFLYLAQFLWHFLKVSISSRGELWRGKSCKG